MDGLKKPGEEHPYDHIPGYGEWPPERAYTAPKALVRLGRRAGLEPGDIAVMLRLASRPVIIGDLHRRIKERHQNGKLKSLISGK